MVLEPPEDHTILHMAPLPLADPEDTGTAAAPPAPRPLSLLHPWIRGQEAVGGLIEEGKTAGRCCIPPFLLSLSFQKAHPTPTSSVHCLLNVSLTQIIT